MQPRPSRLLAAAVTGALLLAAVPPAAQAQMVNPTPSQRQYRAFIPQDQIVSFLPETPFAEFVALLNPVFKRVTNKLIVDPEARTTPIGVSIAGMHFIDAFELVLDMHGLDYRETEGFFIIQDPPPPPPPGSGAQLVGTDGASARAAAGAAPPASAASREIRIDAHIFELNVNRLREVGTNWAAIFGETSGTGTGGTGTGTGNQGSQNLRLFLNTSSFFDSLSDVIEGPQRVDFAEITRLFRYFESIGAGETIASPSVTVQSGEQGRIQSGTDIPITLQDFAGNTITQYIATGVIIDVKPTLIVDTSDGPNGEPIEFIHLDVTVEKSSGRPGPAGVTIDKNQTKTQVLLLDGEQTVIGGLFSTEESVARRGVPILKDIPLLNYFFSYRQRTTVQKELLIVLQARVVDPLRARAGRPLPENLYDRERQDVRQRLDRFKPGAGEELRLIDPSNVERLEPAGGRRPRP